MSRKSYRVAKKDDDPNIKEQLAAAQIGREPDSTGQDNDRGGESLTANWVFKDGLAIGLRLEPITKSRA
eukprot:8016253-Pyramimonas_sp.AAC.1